MKLFQVILKLIVQYNLAPSDQIATLTNDLKDWEQGCTEDHEDKIKAMYAKIHKGIYVRLAIPFIYFFMVRWVDDLINPSPDRFLDE
jgi:hypothetical protein